MTMNMESANINKNKIIRRIINTISKNNDNNNTNKEKHINTLKQEE